MKMKMDFISFLNRIMLKIYVFVKQLSFIRKGLTELQQKSSTFVFVLTLQEIF